MWPPHGRGTEGSIPLANPAPVRPKAAPAHPPPSLGLRREAVAVATRRGAGRGCSAQAWLPADGRTCLRRAGGSLEGRALLSSCPPYNPPFKPIPAPRRAGGEGHGAVTPWGLSGAWPRVVLVWCAVLGGAGKGVFPAPPLPGTLGCWACCCGSHSRIGCPGCRRQAASSRCAGFMLEKLG